MNGSDCPERDEYRSLRRDDVVWREWRRRIRHASPADYGRVIQHVNAWWGGRDMAPMLPKLFFLHFEGTSFVAEDDEGKLVAFLIGFLSQTDPDEAYIHFVGVAP